MAVRKSKEKLPEFSCRGLAVDAENRQWERATPRGNSPEIRSGQESWNSSPERIEVLCSSRWSPLPTAPRLFGRSSKTRESQKKRSPEIQTVIEAGTTTGAALGRVFLVFLLKPVARDERDAIKFPIQFFKFEVNTSSPPFTWKYYNLVPLLTII